MRRAFAFFLFIVFLVGCADEKSILKNYYQHYPYDYKEVKITILNSSVLATPTLKVSAACDNVFNTNATGDWSIQNLTITSSVSIINGKNCRITLNNYFDGTNTFTPLVPASPLVIAIASNGSVTTTSAFEYTNGATPTPTLQWFSASIGASNYTVAISFANNAVSATTSLTPTVLSTQTVSLANAGVTAPSVSNILITETVVLLVHLYTFTAVVSNSTACKYIDNSGGSPPYNPSNWISVNSAYNNASATTCPVLIPGSPLLVAGNWNNLWKTGVKTLVIWANTLNGISAYTTSNIGP